MNDDHDNEDEPGAVIEPGEWVGGSEEDARRRVDAVMLAHFDEKHCAACTGECPTGRAA